MHPAPGAVVLTEADVLAEAGGVVLTEADVLAEAGGVVLTEAHVLAEARGVVLSEAHVLAEAGGIVLSEALEHTEALEHAEDVVGQRLRPRSRPRSSLTFGAKTPSRSACTGVALHPSRGSSAVACIRRQALPSDRCPT
ncbi:MAG: hypothetical protein EB084_04125 [Proteobacteria bacterium]|nr:hypothetical protein [Pseudomonadota bacterium]